MRSLFCLLAVAAVVAAQDKEPDKKGPAKNAKKAPASPAYKNNDLKLKFSGVYGWEKKAAGGSGAWTELVRYTFEQFGARVVLLVRDNPHGSFPELRSALEAEFKAGGHREAQFREASMKRGLKLPAIEVEALRTVETPEGKKREFVVMTRTYFGKSRLFRVSCNVRRARAKRVRDLLQSAMAGLEVTSEDEKILRGQLFQSNRGRYSCVVPEGFTPVLPARPGYDMRFAPRRGGVSVIVFAYIFEGDNADHLDELIDFYGEDFKVGKEAAKTMGGTGFSGTVKRKGAVTRIAGRVVKNRVWRVHTAGPESRQKDVDRVHAEFLKGFRPSSR